MTPIDLTRIPAGSVDLHDARRRRRWTVDLETFELGTFPVTRGQYAELIEAESSASRRPAGSVSWLDAVAFCNAASLRDEIEPAYVVEGDAVIWRAEAAGYRLPTEAEWEYACRAGTSGPQYGPLADVAWTALDGVDHPQDVGSKTPNGFGVHDTLGNVWEWCWDWLDPARYGDYHVFRGGGFADRAWSVRASARRGGAPGMSHPDVGFRVAMGGFAHGDTVQGWSAVKDAERAATGSALPLGWTPRRPDETS